MRPAWSEKFSSSKFHTDNGDGVGCAAVWSSLPTRLRLNDFRKFLPTSWETFSSQSLIFKINRNRQKYLEKRNLRTLNVPPLARIGSARISGQGAFSLSPGWKFYFSVASNWRRSFCANSCHSCSTSVAQVRRECTGNPHLRWRGFSGISVMGARNIVAAASNRRFARETPMGGAGSADGPTE